LELLYNDIIIEGGYLSYENLFIRFQSSIFNKGSNDKQVVGMISIPKYLTKDHGWFSMQKTDVLLFSILFLIIIFSSCSNNNDDRLLQENFALAPLNGVLPIMPLTEVKGLERGCPAVIRTVTEGDQKVDLNAQYLEIQGIDDNCLILCQTQDSQFATWGGIVAGMSGSPVIIDGRIIGALAYGFSGTTNPPYLFGVTPIEYMLALSNKKPAEDNLNEAMKAPAAFGEMHFKPLAIPISITGHGGETNPVDFGNNTEVFFNLCFAQMLLM
jgi:hypothetical protein